MIRRDQIDELLSSGQISGSSGESVGKVGQVYVDDQTGEPEWVTVKTGLFGTSETFVPLTDANSDSGEIRVPYDKDTIKNAPRIDAEGKLNEEQEADLYRYYGFSDAASASGQESSDGGLVSETESRTVGHDTSGPTTDDAMTRSEEQLNVGTERVESGRARLRKYVVTDTQQVQVPVSREEIRVEREPITDGNAGQAYDGPAISEEEHEVVLHEERAVVTKEAVPVERVRLDKETVTDTETVSEEVRKEQIDLDSGVEDIKHRS